jgi:uncharacterized protein YbjT (DUF2867 family)
MIVVTTPTGTIGSQVLQGLIDRNAPVRVIVRDPARLPPHVRERVEIVQGSHGDAEVVGEAFAGADTVFWLVPPDYRTRSVEESYLEFTRAACEVFADGAVERVVAVSALGRGSAVAGSAGLVTGSLAMRDAIAKTGVSLRALAPPSFMENFLTQVEAIRSRGAFFDVLSADRRLPACATRDIAAVAVELLLADIWTGQEDVLVLGPDDLSCNDMANIVSEVLDRPVRYQQIPSVVFKSGLVGNGMSEAMAQGLIDMRLAKDQGLDDIDSGTPRTVTPTGFRQWCEDVLRPAVLA